jgi:hypothetical protein
MSNVKQSLEDCLRIDGALGAAIVDWRSGMTLGTAGGNSALNLDIAAAGNTDVVRAKLKVMDLLGLNDKIEDMLITLGQQYHLLRPLKNYQDIFIYLVLSRSQGNLAMARLKLTEIEKKITL